MNLEKKGKSLINSLTRPRSASVDSPFSSSNGALDLQCSFSHEYLKTDPAFNPAEVAGQKPAPVTSTSTGVHSDSPFPSPQNAKAATKELATKIIHPKRTIIQHYQSKTAKGLSKGTRPYITPQSDREFLSAHDALFKAENQAGKQPPRKTRGRKGTNSLTLKKDRKGRNLKTRSRRTSSSENVPSQGLTDEDNAEIQRKKVELLEAHRQSITVAWITSRHIKGVRLSPSKITDFPKFDDERFVERDENGAEIRFKWERYIGQLLLYYTQPFTARYVDVDECKSPRDAIALIERLIMATEPWQEWWMGIRDLYRWERSRRTMCWYGVFAFLWHTQHVVGFVYAYIIFVVLKSRYYPADVAAIRKSLDRSIDRGAQAYRFGEMVDRYGRDSWLEPVIDEMAPFIRIQIGDLVSFLEITRNFYYWRDPRMTAASLFFFFSCLLITLLTDMEFCMKIVSFVIIHVFFFSWPVSSRYPRYRFLVSPFRWAFWDIPTYPEWAIRFLQQHENIRRHEMKTHELADKGLTFSSKDSLPKGEDTQVEIFQDAVENQDQATELYPGQAHQHEQEDATSLRAQSVYFTTYQRGHEGQLIISSEGLSFVENPRLLTTLNQARNMKPRLDHEPRWSYRFSQLLQMTKRHSPTTSKLAGLDRNLGRLDLEFLVDDATTGEEEMNQEEMDYQFSRDDLPGETKKTKIESLDVNQDERDEIFNLILGWSKSRWQAISADDIPAQVL